MSSAYKANLTRLSWGWLYHFHFEAGFILVLFMINDFEFLWGKLNKFTSIFLCKDTKLSFYYLTNHAILWDYQSSDILYSILIFTSSCTVGQIHMQHDHDPSCRSCAHPTEDLLHLFNCPATADACLALQRCLSLYQPTISPQQTLLLNLVVEPSVELL